MDVPLMAGIPDEFVQRRLEDAMECHGQFRDSEARAEVSADLGHDVDVTLPHFRDERFQILSRQRTEIRRRAHLFQYRHRSLEVKSMDVRA
jgi:hypothetical protein